MEKINYETYCDAEAKEYIKKYTEYYSTISWGTKIPKDCPSQTLQIYNDSIRDFELCFYSDGHLKNNKIGLKIEFDKNIVLYVMDNPQTKNRDYYSYFDDIKYMLNVLKYNLSYIFDQILHIKISKEYYTNIFDLIDRIEDFNYTTQWIDTELDYYDY